MLVLLRVGWRAWLGRLPPYIPGARTTDSLVRSSILLYCQLALLSMSLFISVCVGYQEHTQVLPRAVPTLANATSVAITVRGSLFLDSLSKADLSL